MTAPARLAAACIPLQRERFQAAVDGQQTDLFTLNGKPYQLTLNSGVNSLHGGVKGSRFRVFDVRQIDTATCELTLDYADGDQGYPGHVRSRVVYQVTDDNALDIRYEAVSDAPTIVNFTSHGFFNLAGHAAANEATTRGHVLTIPADTFTPSDANLITTGERQSVTGTALDFRQPVPIGARINDPYLMHPSTRGYDHNWVVDKPPGEYGLAATLYEPATGREMQVLSTEPGLVFFSGNNFTGEAPRDVGKGGKVYHCRAGLCLEPGKFPDTPNQPHFPSAVLTPGERYGGVITYRFAVR